eukprot:CAMPEP_0168519276 /NCGR_PEP_ID=MMETSP0405-20121227/7219_1 /TAXON_ID=498012 /ORGANISM="Trichosphaerium sp, Strain Am-I-7 wt" /LENGTH=341 /DNA_ID=CAMNT_0008539783 /DNA_START=9 /DNA_END=1031 /DNA_ORIENTATION=+
MAAKLVDELITEGAIKLKKGKIFDVALQPFPDSFNYDEYVEGMLLCVAIGDALGYPTESHLPNSRWETHGGDIVAYNSGRQRDKKKEEAIGGPSDDTQMTYWTLAQMIEDKGCLNFENIAKCFLQSKIFGIGQAVREATSKLRYDTHWTQSGAKSAGNGSLMRMAPVILPNLKVGGSQIWSDVVLLGLMTHNDPVSMASCIAFVYMAWQALSMESPPPPNWYLETFLKVAEDLEPQDSSYKPRGGKWTSYSGTLCGYVKLVIAEACKQNWDTRQACNNWFSGAYLLETVPCVLYILMKHGSDLKTAIIRSVNDTKDNDTVAAIVGMVLGALHGKSKIPELW